MHQPSVWIATLPQPQIARHFSAQGMPDSGRVISLRAALERDRRRTRPRSPSRCLLRGPKSRSVPGPFFELPQHGTGDRRLSLAPSAGSRRYIKAKDGESPRKHHLGAEQRRALQLIASSPFGVSKAVMFAHGFKRPNDIGPHPHRACNSRARDQGWQPTCRPCPDY
jgi:hypothetical protein